MALPADLTRAGPLLEMHAALQARLKAFFPPAHFDHQTVPANLTPNAWAALLRRTPLIGLGWGGLRPDRESTRVLRCHALWTAFVVVRNANSPLARLVGDAMGFGQLGVAQVACVALQGFTMPGLGTVAVTDVSNLAAERLADETTALTGINFEVGVTLASPPAGDDVADFLRVQVQWNLDPAGTGPLDMINVRD